MKYEEVTPHFNTMVRLNLKNNRRKVGWLYHDCFDENSENENNVICCLDVDIGRRLIQSKELLEKDLLKERSERIPLSNIRNIRCLK